MKYTKEVIPVIPPKEIVTGHPAAPVTIMMFGDYESEASARANEAVKELLEKFEGSVNFIFRHFPLTRIHQKAHKAAEAAIGAAQEGLFWEMHQHLFTHKQNLGVISLKSYAREVGVKDKKFLDHLINSDWGWFVQDDLKEGLRMGVTEIPVLFINGTRFEKDPSFRNLKQHIEGLLSHQPSIADKRKEKKRA
ncbi:MAG TPA: thioredoxin domain-containing protein [Flavisolibacter sp.]|nr:thioredoxin domain-containing protein [Flavisolibacter sp.]